MSGTKKAKVDGEASREVRSRGGKWKGGLSFQKVQEAESGSFP